jgi:hypothetical protein
MEKRLKLASRVMQAGILGIAVAGLLTANFTWMPAAVLSLFISIIPSILRRDLELVLPIELNFWIVLALFLHVIGGFSGFYDSVPGWDHLTHAMSASLVAALGFVVVVSVDKYIESISLPRPFLAFFIIMFTMAFGVIWELMEFSNDQLTGSRLQYDLDDTMVDMMFDAFGGFIVGIAGAHYLTHTTPEHFVESLKVERTKEKISGFLEKRARSKGGK